MYVEEMSNLSTHTQHTLISRVSEPEPGGSETLRHLVDILLLELMKAYIFFITLGTLLKSLFTNLLYI